MVEVGKPLKQIARFLIFCFIPEVCLSPACEELNVTHFLKELYSCVCCHVIAIVCLWSMQTDRMEATSPCIDGTQESIMSVLLHFYNVQTDVEAAIVCKLIVSGVICIT